MIEDLDPDEFRRHAHATLERATSLLRGREERPVAAAVLPGDVRRLLPKSPPRRGEPLEDVLRDFERTILPGVTHWNHPGFHAYFCSSGSGPGILGELLTAVLNANCMTWRACPAGTELEEVTLDWLRQLLGLPATFRGVIYDGGSASTLHALIAARETVLGTEGRERGLAGAPPLRIYATSETHASVTRAAVAVGLGRASVRRIPTDPGHAMRPERLADAVREDRAAGRRPCAVVATVGSTSLATVDPVARIAEICRSERIWLHVDAAYGGAIAVTDPAHRAVRGWEQADSVLVNPHKWLFVPLDLSVLFLRRREALREAFHVDAAYLRNPEGPGTVDFSDYGIPLGRRFRALKLWFVLRYFGAEGLAELIGRHVELARDLGARIEAHPLLELFVPVSLSTVCFRLRAPRGNLSNLRLLERINRSGRVFLSHTEIGGEIVLRAVIGHVGTTATHVDALWNVIETETTSLVAEREAHVRCAPADTPLGNLLQDDTGDAP